MAPKSPLMFQANLLKEDAKELSRRHTFTYQDKDILPIKPRLEEAREVLTKAYKILATSVKQNKDITPAAEWLIDNFYIIQEQIVQVENDFPLGYQRNLPHLSSGSNTGMPRVYDIVQNLALHTDNVIDIEDLTRYIQSYQEELPLKIGELWAVPVMVRFVLIRHLANKASRVLKRRNIRTDIQDLVTRLVEQDTDEPGRVLRRVIEWLDGREDSYDDRLLYVELANQLQGAGLISEEEKKWFEYRLRSYDTTLYEALRDEAQRQSKLQVSIRNAIISMREASETEWQDFVEACSIVDQILHLDPMETFTDMDSGTKNKYRSTVERLSSHSEYTEKQVAEEVLVLTESHINHSGRDANDIFKDYSVLKKHVGYYLLGEGYDELTRRIDYKMPLGERIRLNLEKTAGYYIGFISVFTFILLGLLWLATDAVGSSVFVSLSVLLVGFFPALELSISAINRFFVFWLPPRILPKMKIEEGIPDQDRTIVVVPTLVGSPAEMERQLEKLEITSLANPDPGLQFVLLSDFTDADQEHMPGDKNIIEKAEREINRLNKKYSSRYGDKFFVLHRQRAWNPSEEKWMGWERKRGKLEKLNELLCNPSGGSPFPCMMGNFINSIQEKPVRFVLTLDADTRTPPDSIIDLVRIASHPLNRAFYDREKDRITKGYSIIQPRISIPPDAANKSLFARIFSGNVGIDPYTTAVSDIYQDLFGEAIFTGKGIYDVRAFHTVLKDRFPENRILSHDLIESNYVRAALSTDIELFDEYPTNYASYCKRNHRWTRGDWQIARWLFHRVPGPKGTTKNPINLLSRWKIFDNLRRSLNPFFLTLFFVTGWFWLPGSALIWTLAAFGILAFPIYVSFSTDIFNRPARIKWKLYFEKVRSNLKINTVQTISTLAILPHQAVLQLDAIGRTLWRLVVAKKRLMEWTSASQAEKLSANDLGSYFRSMAASVVLGIGILVVGIFIDPTGLWIVIPFSLLWISSPFFAKYLSTTDRKEKATLSGEDKIKLRMYARRTWFYFERLVNKEYAWLPPDNDQEDPPLPPVARTSPTNIGLTLVSTQVAYEMGYITMSELLTRLENTLNSLTQLERYKGHFFNWYEINLGEALNPKYVSTVDSGNLAAGLIVIKQAVSELMNNQNPNGAFWDGLSDTIETLRSIVLDIKKEVQNEEICTEMIACLNAMEDLLKSEEPTTISDSLQLLDDLKDTACNLCGHNTMELRGLLGDEQMDDLLYWLESPLRQVESYKHELRQLKNPASDDSLETSPAERLKNLENETKNSSTYKLLKRWEAQIESIIDISERLVSEMDFRFLYDKKRGLFSIGYNVEKAELDQGTYDLLASEARIASLIAIAKGDVPSEHWFRLSRRLTSRNEHEFLLSWGGTTFEYLMPHLFQKSYPNTLLSHTYGHIVDLQREYAEKFDRPWGFSESAYNSLNMDLHYQYRAFGVPGLGLKRGLAEDFVVAPYASVLSLMIDPVKSLDNLEELEKIGALGLKGFYDAVDFTPDHLPKSETYKVVKTYMVHHHGMSFMALLNVLHEWPIPRYFHSDPQINAYELLLQERIPRGIPIKEPYPIDVEMEPGEQHSITYTVDHAGMNNLDESPPRVHLLSNGRFHSFISHAGTGCSRYDDIRLTGWKPDATEDPLGAFIYIKDRESGNYWSAFHQPVKRKPDRYDTWFHNGKVQTSRVDEWIETTTEVCVSPENPIELRKVTLTNYSDRERNLELTSYAEIVLNGAADHKSHPAFSKLFLQTDYLAEHHGIIAWRRPRNADEDSLWMVHMVASNDLEHLSEPLQFETERANFIGRGRSLENPQAMDPGFRLTGSIGNVLDPILSLRRTMTLGPGEKMQVTFGTGWAGSREEAEELADMFDNPHAVERAFELSSIYNTVELEHIGINGKQFQYFQKLAGYMLYNDSRFRSDPDVLIQNRRQQSGLWTYGISGDHPICVFRISKTDQLKSLKRMLKGHLLWKHRGLRADLVIINDHPPSYADELQEGIQQAIEALHSSHKGHGYGEVFTLRSDRLSRDDLTLILTVASVVLKGTLPKIETLISDHTEKVNSFSEDRQSQLYQKASIAENKTEENIAVGNNLQFFNGYGGFANDGHEYRIIIKPDFDHGTFQHPPAPWINVVANSKFGFLATESGAGYTWSENSRENKLTSWSNDPVLDPPAEAFYIRDEEKNVYWSPTPAPAPGQHRYEVSHGFGYTRYEHTSHDIESELLQFVPENDPVKISRLTIRNKSNERRDLSLFSYHAWVIGINREDSSPYIIQEADKEAHAVFAQNHYNNEFAGRVVFASSSVAANDRAEFSFTTDRQEFIGRNASLKSPAAVIAEPDLDNTVHTGGDPCAAFQIKVEMEPGEEMEWITVIGEAKNNEEAKRLVQRYQRNKEVDDAFRDIKVFWEERLGRIRIETPDSSLNQLMNGWLMYQNIACRMFSRTGFYQAGGAYGFRDQLQDAMTALYIDPLMTREQILLHASRQFPEGDVQHWWHPPTGRGVRTRISDDRLWLPYVVNFYIESTGDEDILDEQVPYLEARSLEDHEHEVYLEPQQSNKKASLYEHCIRAIEVTMKTGQNGLPLMGAGDWNDGMNRVGDEGKGESVWLGFFLHIILGEFAQYCEKQGEKERAERYQAKAQKLAKHLNKEGWDGAWYLRAFYDDGTPLGSSGNEEGRIDAIAQSWSVISGVAPEEKKQKALDALERYLVSKEDRIIRLLTPPFDQSDQNPGYIKGYIPGVRENGGQYTHAAVWAIKAFAESGLGDKAVEYLHMINPVTHASTPELVSEYMVEPYVVAADVYGEPPLTGRGGWTWYTGSAGWMYRVALESILGIRIKEQVMTIQPAISSEWDSYRLEWRLEDGETVYRLEISNPEGLQSGGLKGSVDDEAVYFSKDKARIPLKNDGKYHSISLKLISK